MTDTILIATDDLDTLIRLRLGAKLIHEAGDAYTVSTDPPPIPFLCGLLRALLNPSEADRIPAIFAARVWLTAHCAFCGAKLAEAEFSYREPAWCAACAAARDSGALTRMGLTDALVVDRASVAALLTDPTISDAERSQLYLLTMGQELSRLARMGSRDHGRGAVLIDDRPGKPFTAYYIADATVRRGGTHWPSDQIAQWIGEYNPEQQMIVMVNREGGRVESYRMTLAEADDEDVRPRRVVAA